jgi:hypothetical protein
VTPLRVVLLSPLVMQRTMRRLVLTLLVLTVALLIATVAVAKIMSMVDNPHDAAAFVETTLGTYLPAILVAIAIVSLAVAFYPLHNE